MGCSSNRAVVADEGKNKQKVEPINSNKEKAEVKTENKAGQSKPKIEEEELILKTFKGIIADGCPFDDCVIKNETELEEKLRQFIPAQKVTYEEVRPGVMAMPKVKYVPNSDDEILNKKFPFNFDKNRLIAVRGANILKVEIKGENYLATHDGQPQHEYNYFAVLVAGKGNLPEEFLWDSEKPNYIMEQRALNNMPMQKVKVNQPVRKEVVEQEIVNEPEEIYNGPMEYNDPECREELCDEEVEGRE
jgi:hypothetical protein